MEGLVPASGAFDADKFEDEHVHGVYDAIARHFSHTRYKPWPRVASFLQSLEDGALVADVGCGNGKYLQVFHGWRRRMADSMRAGEPQGSDDGIR